MSAPRRPKVSVLIPTFNRAAYIAAAIDSVLQQTFSDFEIIVVDDGSTDDTARVLEPYAKRLTCVRTPNQGPALARNVGMEAAQGEYVAYLDSDDLYSPFKLELQLQVLEARPDVGLVYTECSGFDDAGFCEEWHLRTYHSSAYRDLTYADLFPERARIADTPLAATLSRAGHGDWANHAVYYGDIFDRYLVSTIVFTNSVMFRRSLLARAGLQRRRFGLFHDLEFVLRLTRLAPVAFVDIPTYKLRYHFGQISTTNSPAGWQVAIRKQRDLLRVLKAYCREDPSYYAEHRAALDLQLGRLCRAVALPMLAWTPRSRHERRVYPARARCYLVAAAQLGIPDRVAWLTSFVPRPLRRLAYRALRTADRWSGSAGRGPTRGL